MTVLKVLSILVVLSLPVCMVLVVRKHLALTRAVQYEGTVVAHVLGSGRGRSYALKIKYRDADKRTHTFVTSSASFPPARALGEPVTVFHHADGSRPDVLLFADLYLVYWLWICVAIAAAGCLIFPSLLDAIYLRP